MPLVDLREDENLVESIIDQSGLMQKIKEKEEETTLPETFLTAFLLTIPIVCCHFLFDYLVHLQFGFEKEISLQRFINVQGKASAAIFGFALLTDYLKKLKTAQILYFFFSLYLGRQVILIVNDDGTFGALQKTPGLICTGILLVIQMDLIPATLAVLACLVFNYQKEILGLLSFSGLDLGKPEL